MEEKIKAIIAEHMGIKVSDIKLESNFKEDLGCDSLDLVELTMALEEAFNIEIPDEDAQGLATVAQAIEYIKSKTIK
jgi:acyl carrier protein